MELRRFLVIITFFIPCLAFAQQEFTVNGALYRKNTSERVAQAVITDLRSNVIMMSDELGGFNIIAAKGDTLLVNKNEYSPQKVVVTGPNDLIIYLQPNLQLAEVTVKDKSEKQELNDVVNTYRSKGLYFDGRPPAWSFINSPLTGLYEIFSRDATNERHFIKFSKDEAQANEIDRRYTRQLVKQVTGLPDAGVLKFMQQYRPSYEDMKEWNDYDLISHIKRYLVYYKKHKDDPVPGPLIP
jgi:hypothetical protein